MFAKLDFCLPQIILIRSNYPSWSLLERLITIPLYSLELFTHPPHVILKIRIMASVGVKEKSREPGKKPQEKKEELKALRGGGAGPVISKFFEDCWGWNSRTFPSFRFSYPNGARDQMETPVTVVGLRSRRVGRSHINPSPCSAYCSSIRIFQISALKRAFIELLGTPVPI